MAQEIADSTLLDTWASSGLIVEPDISKIIEGWQLGEQPPHEYMNWLQNTFGSKLNHILKNGVAKWNNETEYLAGATTQHNGSVWICKTTNTNSEPTASNNNWDKIPYLENLALTVDTINDFPTSATTGDTVIVKDLDRGGIFIYDSTKVAEDNQGTNFNGWIRQYSGAVNVKWFGAKGDGVTDDTVAIQKVYSYISHLNGGEIIYEPCKTYILRDIVSCPLSDGGEVIINGNNSTHLVDTPIRYLYTGIITIGSVESNNTKLKVDSLNWNCNGVTLDWNAVNPDGGKGCILSYARTLEVTNCKYANITYSACIWSEYGTSITISNCSGNNVGARSADNTEDARGDAFYFGRLGYLNEGGTLHTAATIKVSNCSVRAHTAVPNVFVNKNSAHCGRVGVTIEGGLTASTKNVIIENCYFYNYNRGVHVENVSNLNLTINNTQFDEYGIGVWVFRDTHLSNISIENSTFKRLLNIQVPDDNTNGGLGGYVVETVRDGSTNKINISNTNIIVKPDGGTNIRLFGNIYNLNVSKSVIKLGNLPIVFNAENTVFSDCDISWTGKFDWSASKLTAYGTVFNAEGGLTYGGLLLRPSSSFNSDDDIIFRNCSFKDSNLKVFSTSNNSKVLICENSFNFSSSYIQDSGDYATSISNLNKEEATILNNSFINNTAIKMTAHQQGPIRTFIGNTVVDMFLRLSSSNIPLHIKDNSFLIKRDIGFSFFIDAYLSNAMIIGNTLKTHVSSVGAIANSTNALIISNTYKINELDVITTVS